MTRLNLGPELSIPDDAVTQTFAIFGKRGSGKSNGGTVLAEEMFKAHLPFVVLDPVDAWWGLKASFDGKSAGLGVYTFGGPHGDLPLEPTGGALMADVLVEHRISAVLSFKGWTGADRTRFASDFAARLLAKNTKPLHVFLEEADAFIPQRPQRGEETMLGNFDRMVRWGRQSGLGCTLITQRSAKVNKDVTTQAETLISFRVIGPQDRDAIDNWIKFHASAEQREDVLSSIATLKDGQAWVWSPEWLEILQKVTFRRRTTYDSAATPKVGEKRHAPQRLASVDLERLRSQMAASIEHAQANDPRELRRQLAAATRQIAADQAALARRVEPKIETKRVEVPVLSKQDIAGLERMIDKGQQLANDMLAVTANMTRLVTWGEQPPIPPRTNVSSPLIRDSTSMAGAHGDPPAALLRPQQRVNPNTATQTSATVPSRTSVPSGGAQRILNALAWLESVGIPQAERSQVAALADLAPRAGTFGTYLSRLQSAGLIAYNGKIVRITEAGYREADAQAAPQTTAELHQQIFARLGGGMERMLRELIDAHPNSLDKWQLAQATKLTANAGTFGTYVSRLRSLGFIVVEGGRVAAAPVLFIGG